MFLQQLVNGRLKQTGARWKGAQVGPFGERGAPADNPEGNDFWYNGLP